MVRSGDVVFINPVQLHKSDIPFTNEFSFVKFGGGFANEQRLIYKCAKFIPET